ncbi:hypothetical protein [Saccharothrix sp. HUAS TT1]|uniref:hypothetical protein n=1 Tax=unclassified Saccharothrix TaxID=2593673 RepID=UPI00345C3732
MDFPAALLAGRLGTWTFVYDDSGFTFDGATTALSAGSRSAATCAYLANGNATVAYAVDGEEVFWANVIDLDLETDLRDMPVDLRAAFEAAGTAELADAEPGEPGEPDFAVGLRAVCALAGLTCVLDDVRRTPLLVTAFG